MDDNRLNFEEFLHCKISDKPTIQELAKRTPLSTWPDQNEIITESLVAAGINPANEIERERFRRLAVVMELRAEGDSIETEYYNIASDELGPDATIQEVFYYAQYLQPEPRWPFYGYESHDDAD